MELRYGIIFKRKKIDGEYILKKEYATIGWGYKHVNLESEKEIFHVCMGEHECDILPSVYDASRLEDDYCVRYYTTSELKKELIMYLMILSFQN